MTKSELVKLIVREKENQLYALRKKNDAIILDLKKETLVGLFGEDIKKLNDLGVKYDIALSEFVEKVKAQNYTIGFEFYSGVLSATTLIRNSSLDTEEGVIHSLMNNHYIQSNTTLGNKIAEIRKSEDELEEEWDKLIVIIKSLSLKEGRKYLEECKIEIPGMDEEPKQTALVNYEVDVTKLFIKEEA